MRVRKVSRREFLQKTAGASVAAVGFPYLVPGSALGNAGSVAASERITLGCIGVGSRGRNNLQSFLSRSQTQVLAICDVDKANRDRTKTIIDEKYGNTDCVSYLDFRHGSI